MPRDVVQILPDLLIIITYSTRDVKSFYGHSGVKPNALVLGYKPAPMLCQENQLDICE